MEEGPSGKSPGRVAKRSESRGDSGGARRVGSQGKIPDAHTPVDEVLVALDAGGCSLVRLDVSPVSDTSV